MIRPTARILAYCSISLLGLLATAQASSLKVPSQYPTIGSAIAFAAPGDTILIGPGLYAEQVVIPSVLAGLRVKGSKAAILDPTGIGPGPALTVEAAGVRIENLTVRHAYTGEVDGYLRKGHGIEVTGGAYEVELKTLRVLNSADHGVIAYAPGVLVKDCEVMGGEAGILVWGADSRVLGCEVDLVQKMGIKAGGDRTSVMKNEVRGVSKGPGIYLLGVDCMAEKNRVTTCSLGLLLQGSGATARKNEASGCSTGCLVWGPSARVEGNDVSYCGEVGIYVYASNASILDNDVERCGDGVLIEADDALLHDNVSRRNAVDGYRLQGSRAMLVGNRAEENGVDGFDVEAGYDNELIANVARKNHGEGVENNATATVIQMNEATKNRLDVAMDAAPAVFSKNVYSSGGPGTPPAVD